MVVSRINNSLTYCRKVHVRIESYKRSIGLNFFVVVTQAPLDDIPSICREKIIIIVNRPQYF